MIEQNKIFILGFPRSGTSVLAKFFMEMGFKMSLEWNFWDEKLNAGYENKKVSFINNLLSFSYEEVVNANYMDVVLDYMSKIDDEVIKYPRFIFETRILDKWLDLFPNSKIILTYRKPEKVLQSKRVITNDFPFSEEQLKKAWWDCYKFLQEKNVFFCYLSFPEFLGMYDEIHKVLGFIGVNFNKEYGRSVWENIVDYSKVHFK